MRAHLRYARYLARHKWFVFVAGWRLGVPLRALLVHDRSKLSRAEWGPYARRFFAGRGGLVDKSEDTPEFRAAWEHHWRANPHHWEWWVDRGYGPRPMTNLVVREMVADWSAAGRASKAKQWDVRPWYEENQVSMRLHPDTRVLVEYLVPLTARRV